MKSTVILLLLAFATLGISTRATSQELVLYFPFEGAGDTVTDESGHGNDGEFDNGQAQRVDSLRDYLNHGVVTSSHAKHGSR
jgi:hypothetical protein